MELVFVHAAKTGGKSVFELLRSHYGPVRSDNGDGLVNPEAPFNQDRAAACAAFQAAHPTFRERAVHGHFWLPKYDHVPGRRATFLRHPVTRTISHFVHWRTRPPKPTASRLQHDVHEGRVGLDEFITFPQIRWFYTRTVFGGVDMRRFDFIGRFEAFDAEAARLQALIGAQGPVPHVNSSEGDRPDLPADLFQDDVEFYHEWTKAPRPGR